MVSYTHWDTQRHVHTKLTAATSIYVLTHTHRGSSDPLMFTQPRDTKICLVFSVCTHMQVGMQSDKQRVEHSEHIWPEAQVPFRQERHGSGKSESCVEADRKSVV